MKAATKTEAEFTAFVANAGPGLARTAALLTGNRTTADDLLQKALVRVYLNWPKVIPGAEKAYARRVMSNLATDWWRRAGWERVGPPPERSVWSPTNEVDDDDAFLRHLAGLSARERAVLVLRFHADLTEAQAAEELGLPLGTVKSLAARALAKLRTTLTLEPSGSNQ